MKKKWRCRLGLARIKMGMPPRDSKKLSSSCVLSCWNPTSKHVSQVAVNNWGWCSPTGWRISRGIGNGNDAQGIHLALFTTYFSFYISSPSIIILNLDQPSQPCRRLPFSSSADFSFGLALFAGFSSGFPSSWASQLFPVTLDFGDTFDSGDR